MFETASEGKTVVLGVTGSITAYKIVSLASMLKRMHADVGVIMTENATESISSVTFESLTGKRCLVETLDRDFEFSVGHMALAKRAGVFLIVPVSASVIGEVSHGMADDTLTTTLLVCGCHKIIASAMGTHIYENPILQDSLKRCESYGMEVLKPAVEYLACGDTGAGRMPEPEMLLDYIVRAVDYGKDMTEKKVLVMAEPVREAIDPVRSITNHSTGKTGYAVAKIVPLRDVDMTLVSGSVSIEASQFVEVVPVGSVRQVYEAVTAVSGEQDITIEAAAVADYRPTQAADEKVKKKDGELPIDPCHTDDILGYPGGHKRDGQFLCGFPMETQNMLENSRAELSKRHLDMTVANNPKVDGAGFGTSTNVVTVITGDGELELEKMSKEEVAGRLLDEIMKRTAGPT